MKVARSVFIAASLLASLSANVSGKRLQAPSDFQVSLIREYGRASFEQCRLDIAMYARPFAGTASLECKYVKPGLPFAAREQLSDIDARQLRELLLNPQLWTGNGGGTDSRRVDGIFERLEIRAGSNVTILVTSGNPSFSQGSARGDFLAALKTIERRLANREKAK